LVVGSALVELARAKGSAWNCRWRCDGAVALEMAALTDVGRPAA
jgi:hypothetical protein